ncbi:hypothetical protein DPMN_022114 [Dreissena polymorpha]|uniref:Uncharacterized protein n=1 Tax=Dreissena polymorpha TaxID=45954 RepID=A0A9D4NJS1_DREPO|nr:hypothetical protein DPMN_022114 [Dreissena polymorpha]
MSSTGHFVTIFLVLGLVGSAFSAALGGTCATNAECTGTTHADVCTTLKCACKTGYAANTGGTACIATGALKGTCTASTDCTVTTNAGTCTSGKCECNTGYTANTDETACSSGVMTLVATWIMLMMVITTSLIKL